MPQKKASLDALINILRSYEEDPSHEYNAYALRLVDAGGLARIQQLILSEDEHPLVVKAAANIESAFFGEKYKQFIGARVKSARNILK